AMTEARKMVLASGKSGAWRGRNAATRPRIRSLSVPITAKLRTSIGACPALLKILQVHGRLVIRAGSSKLAERRNSAARNFKISVDDVVKQMATRRFASKRSK